MRERIRQLADELGLPTPLADRLERVLVEHLDGSSTAPESTAAMPVDETAPSVLPSAAHLDARYVDLGPIGTGGMGEVRRVRDRSLHRVVALKTLRPGRPVRPITLDRFLAEARTTAQLQHPNIVPVYDMGLLPDGRWWFTMKEVEGVTLKKVIESVHAGDGTFGFRRLISAFLAVCRAVAYAHARGVVHRDLKPINVMVGSLGEVYVLDWGVAKFMALGDAEIADPELTQATARATATQHGQVIGTPAYMPPEQARGELDEIDQRSDVYALGAILYEVLSGRPPYAYSDGPLLEQLLDGPPPPLTVQDVAGVRCEELVAAANQAMEREPRARFPDAAALAQEVEAWLDGARRREQALAVTSEALAADAEVATLRERARSSRSESEALLQGLEPWRSEEDKSAGWACADEAAKAEREASLLELQIDQALHAALQIDAGLPEAHAALAERYRQRHAHAECRREPDRALREEQRLRTHLNALPASSEVRRACEAYLQGDGRLTLHSEPQGAEVRLHRYETQNRRLVEVFERSLGVTPLDDVRLSMGSYLCTLHLPNHAVVRYPVEIARGGRWTGCPPGEAAVVPIWMPPDGELGPGDVYVPAGWFHSGGDPESYGSHRARQLWCDGFVIQRFPVTYGEYVAFLNDLLDQEREDEALRHVPRERADANREIGAALLLRDEGGRFVLQRPSDGEAVHPDLPVAHVDWHGARAYLDWLARSTGRPYRLPGELEWEKAARGVDGRWYPWGDFLDPSWCRTLPSARGRDVGDFGPVVVDSYPVDRSPYGVRGLAGNVRDWCLDPEGRVVGGRVVEPDPAAPGPRVVRGGTAYNLPRYARAALRYTLEPENRFPNFGFRGAWRLGEGGRSRRSSGGPR